MKYEAALKQTRRNTFVWEKNWRVAVVARTPNLSAVAWDEAKALIEASSLGLVRANYATRTMELERGALIRFVTLADPLDIYKYSGHMFTQIIVLDPGADMYPAGSLEYMRAMLRSPVVPTESLLFQEYVTL